MCILKDTFQGSPPLRRRYRDRNDYPTFLPSPPSVTHPHQSTVMMDINQVIFDYYFKV